MEMLELVDKLNDACDAYYNSSMPIMSDSEYDKLYDELVKLEREAGRVLEDSPTQRIGYEVKSGLEKVEHDTPLLSLDKTKNIEELKQFMGNRECIISLKCDGLTTKLKYKTTKLAQGSTRGNGYIGENITHNVKTYKNLSKHTNLYVKQLELVGESVILKQDFDELIKTPEMSDYKNPRNLVAGSVRLLDSRKCDKRNVKFFAFGLIVAEGEEFKLKSNQLRYLEEQGFEVSPWLTTNSKTIERDINIVKRMAENIGIPYDGMVVSYDNLEYANSLKSTSKHPKHSLAFKFEDEVVETKLVDVEWSNSRTGAINPVAVFEPVELEGSTVSRASLHNVSIVEELQLGIGDIISVYKANQIIPQVLDNNTRSNTIAIPNKCPICEHSTSIKQSNNSKVLYCDNPSCSTKTTKKIEHYVSRNCMNMLGFGESIIETFVDKGFINNILDIYNIDKYKDDIIKLEGFGVKSYDKLIRNIEKSKEVKLPNFINSLGIPNVGLSGSKLMCEYFENNITKIMDATAHEFISIEGFGEVVSDSIDKFFSDVDNRNMVYELLNILTFKYDGKREKITESQFTGLKIYATGSFNGYSKKDIKVKLESLGAIFENGYKKSLDLLIVGDKKGSSKVDKAKKDSIKVMTETEFEDSIRVD